MSAIKSGTITAKANGVAKSTVVKVRPPGVSSVTLSSDSLIGGDTTIGYVVLETPAPVGGTVVTLKSSNTAAATVSAATITIAAGERIGTFNLNALTVSSLTKVTISAAASGVTKTTVANIFP